MILCPACGTPPEDLRSGSVPSPQGTFGATCACGATEVCPYSVVFLVGGPERGYVVMERARGDRVPQFGSQFGTDNFEPDRVGDKLREMMVRAVLES